MEKICTKCKRYLPMDIEHFHRQSKTKDGFNTRCKECRGSKFGIIHPNRVLDKPEGFKYCTKCMKLKPFNEFDKTPKEKDGYVQKCKSCKHQYYKDNFEHFAEISKTHNQENKDQIKQYHAEYYQKNKDKISKRDRKYYQENKQSIIKYQREYYFDNKENIQEYKKEYAEKNQEVLAEKAKKRYFSNHEKNLLKRREYRIKNDDKIKVWRRSEHAKELMRYHKQKRKARKKELPNHFGLVEWNKCKFHFNNQCAYCGEEKPLEQEHFIPLTNGGEYTINNIICACRNCNSSKNNNNFFEWYPKQEFYSKQREQKILKYLNYKDHMQQLALL